MISAIKSSKHLGTLGNGQRDRNTRASIAFHSFGQIGHLKADCLNLHVSTAWVIIPNG